MVLSCAPCAKGVCLMKVTCMRQEAGEEPGNEVRSSIPGHYVSWLDLHPRGREASDYAAKRNVLDEPVYT